MAAFLLRICGDAVGGVLRTFGCIRMELACEGFRASNPFSGRRPRRIGENAKAS
jgi:hypothetical protein